jgi:hypothetical protein
VSYTQTTRCVFQLKCSMLNCAFGKKVCKQSYACYKCLTQDNCER